MIDYARPVNPFADAKREKDTGAIILGDPSTTCPYCSATAQPTYSTCGRVVWWHAPTDCCDKRRELQHRADLRIEAREQREREARYKREADAGHVQSWQHDL